MKSSHVAEWFAHCSRLSEGIDETHRVVRPDFGVSEHKRPGPVGGWYAELTHELYVRDM